MQEIFYLDDNYLKLGDVLKNYGRKYLLVCDSSFSFLNISKEIVSIAEKSKISFVIFNKFQSNPQLSSVVEGVKAFNEKKCDAIFAIGGGSAMDVAKAIKLFAKMDQNKNFLSQKIVENDIKLFVMPTTAGTGSEATKFSVIYYNGEKQSITHESCIPFAVFYDPTVLQTLPLYQKKVTFLDALCHAIESFWSVNSTEDSRELSTKAISILLNNYKEYLKGDSSVCLSMFDGAYFAGQAINIAQTTAGHAMSYKLTSLYGIAHGHAVAICLSALLTYMITHQNDCIDPRGKAYFQYILKDLAVAIGKEKFEDVDAMFKNLLKELDIVPPKAKEEDIPTLVESVNPVRLKNFPISLSEKQIEGLYRKILNL